MENRKLPIKRLFWAFVITNIVFILVVSIAYSASYLNYQGVIKDYNPIKKSISSLENIASSSDCNNNEVSYSSEKLDEVSIELQLLENRFGKKDTRVIEQKKLYSVLQLAHYRVIKKFNELCNSDFEPFLFFYSNEKKYQDASEKTGYILSAFKQKNPEKIMVYSFDVNLNNEEVSSLKEKYGILDEPRVVFPDGHNEFIDSIDSLMTGPNN